jgi:hypothetical protein
MQLTFLQASMSLTKSFIKKPDNSITKQPYPNAYEFTSHTEQCRDLKQMTDLLRAHAALGHCLLKGEITRLLNSESRAGSTESSAETDWVCLDIDGVKSTTLDDLLSSLGMGDVSYIVQWSASYLIENKDLRCHLFMQLDKRMPAPLLKQWLIHLNHSVSLLSSNMRLTKTGNSLSWALDVTACQNDKLLYIAAPVLKGLKDPLGKTPRIEYVRKAHDTLIIAQSALSSHSNVESTHKRINELRVANGLPARKMTYKVHGADRILISPDSSIVTGTKIERGYVYFNLNGGDSWGYYHPEDNPEFIRNFKDEPVYLTKDLLPEYWKQLTEQAVRTSSEGVTYLVFCDPKTSAYWRGTHDAQTDVLDLHIAKNETQIRHFAKQYGFPLGDFIPEWDVTFDPHDNVRVDVEHRSINTFEPTIYMQATPKKVSKCPPMIFKVMHHALGGDDAITAHFVNWLAYIVQFRDRTKTAWIMHGRTGTGKGVLMNNVIRPLLGTKQTAARRVEDLNESYNAYLEKCFVVYVDEIEAKALVNERGVMAKLKNFITEQSITVRQMYQAAHEVRNYSNWIFASNRSDPVTIDREDRRFNVGKYQPEMLKLEDADFETIESELQAFYDYLAAYPVDALLASTPIDSEDRNNMISISESSVDTVGSALLNGNFEFFIDQLPTTDKYRGNAQEFNRVENYIDTLTSILKRASADGVEGKSNISRDELRVLFDYCVGNVPTTPNKFTSMLKHHRIHTTKVWVEGKAAYGIKTVWHDIARFAEYELLLNPPPPAPKAKAQNAAHSSAHTPNAVATAKAVAVKAISKAKTGGKT